MSSMEELLNISTDPSLLSLPDSARNDIIGYDKVLLSGMGASREPFLEHLRTTEGSAGMVPVWLYHHRFELPGAEQMLGPMPTHMRHLAIQRMMFRTSGRFFTLQDGLNQALYHTDIADNIPAEFFTLPFPRIYLKFGDTPSDLLTIEHVDSGKHFAEGCYLQETRTIADFHVNCPPPEHSHALGLIEGKPVRIIEICAIGSPVGKDNIADDTFLVMTFYIQDESVNLKDLVASQIKISFAHTPREPLDDSNLDNYLRDMRAVMAAAAKAVLYLNLKDIRTETFNQRSELEAKLSRTGPKKQAKLKRQLARSYDRILVSSTETTVDKSKASGRTTQTHWRRGHLRHIACGPGRELRKLSWIAPVLVNKDNLGEQDPGQKSYTVA